MRRGMSPRTLASASDTSRWYRATVRLVSQFATSARLRINSARLTPAASACWSSIARSAGSNRTLTSFIWWRTQGMQCRTAISGMADASKPWADAKNLVVAREDAKSGFSLTPLYVLHLSPLPFFYTRYLSPICVRQGKKIDRDRVFASAICVRLASAVTQVASANRLTMRPS
jgi:hypothetical protein